MCLVLQQTLHSHHLPKSTFRSFESQSCLRSIEPVSVVRVIWAEGALPTLPLALAPTIFSCCTVTLGKSLEMLPTLVLASTWKLALLGNLTSMLPVFDRN